MMGIRSAAVLVAFIGAFSLPVTGARAQTTASEMRVAQAPQAAGIETAQGRVRRSLRRVPIYPRYQPEPDRVYPRYYPGPNAVRDCTATYVQEFRPSGTVIVPRMSCFWRPG
jgi:hypothetical protein